MQIKQLMHFLAAVDLGTIGAAARQQHVTQPALTRSIRKLEASLGSQLLERGRLGVAPTAYGRALAEHARIIVNESRQASGRLAAMRSGRLGSVRLGLGASVADAALVAALSRCALDRKDVTLALHVGYPQTLLAMLRRSELDALVALRPHGAPEPDLQVEPLLRVAHAIVARPAHPFARKPRRRALEELAATPWVVISQPGFEEFWRRELRLDVARLGVLRIRCNTPELVRQFVLEGDYLALLPRRSVQPDLDAGTLVEIEGEMRRIETEPSIVLRKGASRTAALDLVLEEIRASLARPRRGAARRR